MEPSTYPTDSRIYDRVAAEVEAHRVNDALDETIDGLIEAMAAEAIQKVRLLTAEAITEAEMRLNDENRDRQLIAEYLLDQLNAIHGLIGESLAKTLGNRWIESTKAEDRARMARRLRRTGYIDATSRCMRCLEPIEHFAGIKDPFWRHSGPIPGMPHAAIPNFGGN